MKLPEKHGYYRLEGFGEVWVTEVSPLIYFEHGNDVGVLHINEFNEMRIDE